MCRRMKHSDRKVSIFNHAGISRRVSFWVGQKHRKKVYYPEIGTIRALKCCNSWAWGFYSIYFSEGEQNLVLHIIKETAIKDGDKYAESYVEQSEK